MNNLSKNFESLRSLNFVKAAGDAKKHLGTYSSDKNILISSTANLDLGVHIFSHYINQFGLNASVEIGGFNNWYTESFNKKPDFWILHLSCAGLTAGYSRLPTLDSQDVVSAVNRARALGIRPMVILPEFNPIEGGYSTPLAQWRLAFNSATTEALTEIDVPAVSVDHLVFDKGIQNWCSVKYWESARLPFHPDSFPILAYEIAAQLKGMVTPAIRAIAVDLDGTLWDGIVGEVGYGNVSLDSFGNGRAFIQLQTFLKTLKDKGVFLGVLSKNDPDNARSVFNHRNEMVLALSDFVLFNASWEPKVNGMSEFLELINVGADSVCFIDDSSFERDAMRSVFPEMFVPEISDDPSVRVSELLHSGLFERPIVRHEDRLRQNSILANKALKDSRSTSPNYLQDLEMIMYCTAIDDDTVSRAAELVQKTNQFNVSYNRTNSLRILELSQSESGYAYSFNLSDRLGEHGETAILLAEIEGQTLIIIDFVISCRIFSRGVEFAISQVINEILCEKNLEFVETKFHVTEKNKLVGEYLESVWQASNATNVKGEETFRTSRLSIPQHFVKVVK